MWISQCRKLHKFRTRQFTLALSEAEKESLLGSEPINYFSAGFLQVPLIRVIGNTHAAEVGDIFSKCQLAISFHATTNLILIVLLYQQLCFFCKSFSIVRAPPRF